MKLQLLISSIILLNSFSNTQYIKIHDKSQNTLQESTIEDQDTPYNLTYQINPPENTITTLKILQLQFTCKRCRRNHLAITSKEGSYRAKFLNVGPRSELLSFRSTHLAISLRIEKGNVLLHLEYEWRVASSCPNSEFRCDNETDGCYDKTQIRDGKFDCKDHSDETGYSNCAPNWAPCDNWSGICFNPSLQRCNAVLDCHKGEDEVGCSKNCNSTFIDCQNGDCVSPERLCDGIQDCSNAFDEKTCPKQYCKSPGYFLCKNGVCIPENLVGNNQDDCGDFSDELNTPQLVKTTSIASLIVLLALLFTTLVLRWCSSRRDIPRFLQNLPEFPMPPFRGPGDQNHHGYALGYSDSDFRVGGDVYEAFARSRRRMERNNVKDNEESGSAMRTHSGCVNFECRGGGDFEIEIIEALVSLSLPHKMCIGLDRYIVQMMEDSKVLNRKDALKKCDGEKGDNFCEFF